jgi:hypothetical protein
MNELRMKEEVENVEKYHCKIKQMRGVMLAVPAEASPPKFDCCLVDKQSQGGRRGNTLTPGFEFPHAPLPPRTV